MIEETNDDIQENDTEVIETGTIEPEPVVAPRTRPQRFTATLPSDVTQASFQARLNALKDASLPVGAMWLVFVEKGYVSLRIRKG